MSTTSGTTDTPADQKGTNEHGLNESTLRDVCASLIITCEGRGGGRAPHASKPPHNVSNDIISNITAPRLRLGPSFDDPTRAHAPWADDTNDVIQAFRTTYPRERQVPRLR